MDGVSVPKSECNT